MQWRNIWTPVTADDDLVLGHAMIMLLVDALIYLLLTLYIEAVAPGEYGVPKPWYFPIQVRMNLCTSELELIHILHAGLCDIVRWQQKLRQRCKI
jgi:hypothetical protein